MRFLYPLLTSQFKFIKLFLQMRTSNICRNFIPGYNIHYIVIVAMMMMMIECINAANLRMTSGWQRIGWTAMLRCIEMNSTEP